MHGRFPLTRCLRSGYGSSGGLAVPNGEFGGGRERPPFLPPGSALWGQDNVHWRAIAWEGRSRPINPWREGLK